VTLRWPGMPDTQAEKTSSEDCLLSDFCHPTNNSHSPIQCEWRNFSHHSLQKHVRCKSMDRVGVGVGDERVVHSSYHQWKSLCRDVGAPKTKDSQVRISSGSGRIVATSNSRSPVSKEIRLRVFNGSQGARVSMASAPLILSAATVASCGTRRNNHRIKCSSGRCEGRHLHLDFHQNRRHMRSQWGNGVSNRRTGAEKCSYPRFLCWIVRRGSTREQPNIAISPRSLLVQYCNAFHHCGVLLIIG
jgi:hypothetical protein